MQHLLTHIDNYCERTGPELWSEPLNAITNLAFIIAGLWGLSRARATGAGRTSEVLCWWVVAIGIGSALFHTFANELTKWADILPIAIFTLAYTLYNLRRFLGFGWGAALAIFVAFYAAAGLVTWLVPDWLRIATAGSTGYLPPFLALIFFGTWLALRSHPAGRYNLAAAAIFCVSVTFRAIDPVVCNSFPLGSHFMWHTLNGVMLGVILAAVVRFARTETAAGHA